MTVPSFPRAFVGFPWDAFDLRVHVRVIRRLGHESFAGYSELSGVLPPGTKIDDLDLQREVLIAGVLDVSGGARFRVPLPSPFSA
jgi:hypothetical protein